MGQVANVSGTEYPPQDRLGKQVKVMFWPNVNKVFPARVIRFDTTSPHQIIFQLEDGRVIRECECLWQPEPGD